MTESSTQNRTALEVPTPWTLLTVGERYGSTETYSGTNWSGVGVNTDSHVRMFAKGSSTDSDAVGQATGKVWLQSKRNLAAVADKTLLLGSYADTYMAAANGILVMAGFDTANATSEPTAGDLPNAVSSYQSKANIASTVWSAFDIAMGIVTGVTATVQAILLGKFSWLSAGKAILNTVGAGINIAALGWEKDVPLPGLNLFSEGGSFFSAIYGSVNVHGLAGLLVGGLFHYDIAWSSAKVRGFNRVSLSAASSVDVCAGLWYEAKTDGDHSYAARTGPAKVRGVKMKIGQGITKYPQACTLTQTYSSLAETKWSCLKAISLTAMSSIEGSALTDTTVDAVDSISFRAGPFDVTVKNASVSMGSATTGSVLKAAPSGLTLLGPTLASSVKCQPGLIEITAGAGSLKLIPNTSFAIDGVEFSIG